MRGDTTRKQDFNPFILQALVDLGGSGPIQRVIQRIGELMAGRLTAGDREQLNSGGPRWVKNVNFAKMDLAKSGLLHSDRTNWSITLRGREFLRTGHLPTDGGPDAAGGGNGGPELGRRLDRDDALRFFFAHRRELLTVVKRWVEKTQGAGAVDVDTVEGALRELFRS